jgi:hypothetical protein
MTKLEQVENIIYNHFEDDNYKAYKFNCKHWDSIEKEVSNWSAKYFDANIVDYMGKLFK